MSSSQPPIGRLVCQKTPSSKNCTARDFHPTVLSTAGRRSPTLLLVPLCRAFRISRPLRRRRPTSKKHPRTFRHSCGDRRLVCRWCSRSCLGRRTGPGGVRQWRKCVVPTPAPPGYAAQGINPAPETPAGSPMSNQGVPRVAPNRAQFRRALSRHTASCSRRGSLRPSRRRSPAEGIVEVANARHAGRSARGQTLISVGRR